MASPCPAATRSAGCRTPRPRPGTCGGGRRGLRPDWNGVRDATEFAPSCPQSASFNLFFPPGPIDEDCLYLNVSTPTLRSKAARPVLVWIHGGGLTQDAARNYDGTELAADGAVVVTINYRLGALGFLSHPSLASSRDGASGNYGLMDQQAALRWVQENIARFGGDPHKVAIAGQSAGGLSVLAHLVSRGSRGLFQRAIVQSGAFALTQLPLAAAEAFGESFATAVGCPDQTAACLRSVSVDDLVRFFPGAAIPGVVDGRVLTESIGTALAAGRFARVPILNGSNHDEERLFLDGLRFVVSGGTFVGPTPGGHVGQLPAGDRLGPWRVGRTGCGDRGGVPARHVPDAVRGLQRAGRGRQLRVHGAAARPLDLRAGADVRVRVQRRRRAPALRTARRGGARGDALVRAPVPVRPAERTGPRVLDADQEALSASMRAAWTSFAANGDPSTPAVPWPTVADGTHVMSLVPPQPEVETDFAARHHCSFWLAG